MYCISYRDQLQQSRDKTRFSVARDWEPNGSDQFLERLTRPARDRFLRTVFAWSLDNREYRHGTEWQSYRTDARQLVADWHRYHVVVATEYGLEISRNLHRYGAEAEAFAWFVLDSHNWRESVIQVWADHEQAQEVRQ